MFKSPLKLAENRVWRIYLGGKLLDEFRAKDGDDGYFPEDWLASVVTANNPERENAPALEGLSKLDDNVTYLRDVINSDTAAMLGTNHIAKHGENFGVLTKFLDSAERLPIQVHPDKQAAKTYFHSDFGKTEAWYILGGRSINGEEPHILLGFKEDMTADKLHELFDKQDIAAMSKAMHKIPVKQGDVFLIKGGTPHAIGPGCFLLEIQEPTDYTVSLEKCNTLGEKLPDFLCHQGIGFDNMFECFHYINHSLDEFKLKPKEGEKGDGYSVTNLITYDDTTCFSLNRIDVEKSCVKSAKEEKPSALVVIGGKGRIGSVDVKQGDCMFVPACVSDIEFTVNEGDTLAIIECLPPC